MRPTPPLVVLAVLVLAGCASKESSPPGSEGPSPAATASPGAGEATSPTLPAGGEASSPPEAAAASPGSAPAAAVSSPAAVTTQEAAAPVAGSVPELKPNLAPPHPTVTAPAPEQPPAPTPQAPRPPGLQVPEWYKEVQSLYAEATEALRRGDTASAEKALDGVLGLQPTHRAAAMAKARICRESKRDAEALHVLDGALGAQPDDPSLLFEKALTLHDQGDTAATMETLQTIFDKGNRMPEARYLRVQVLAASGDSAGTLEALREAIENGFGDVRRLREDPVLESVRKEPRFHQIVEELVAKLTAAQLPAPMVYEEPAPLPEASGVLDPEELLMEMKHRISQGFGESLGADIRGRDGQRLRLADHSGKVVLLEFWGTWSPASRAEMVTLGRLRDEFREKGVEVYTLCYEINAEVQAATDGAKAFLSGSKLDLPCMIIGAETGPLLRVAKFPSTIFFGRDGKAYLWATGQKDYATLKALTQALLEAAPPSAPPAPK